MPTPKLKEYLHFKKDPALAMFQTVASLRAELNEIMKEMISKELPRRISEIEQIKGDKGDSIKGEPGYTPIKGKDYVDGEKGRSPMFVGKNQPINPQKGDLWYQD